MSSLAAARADNYYYPQEWRPEHGSINKFHGSHPLGKRAKDIADGILVVRFEMPFNVWCAHCEQHIGRGVRFNAKKKEVGKYFSTRIYEFSMNCTGCKHDMVIRTDPKERGYALISGVRRKEEDFSSEQTETEHLNDESLGSKLSQDPFFRLEHEQEDLRAAKKRLRGVEAIVDLNDTHFKDDYASNSALRADFRKKKRRLQRDQDRAESLGLKVPLAKLQQEDVVAAKSVVFRRIPARQKQQLGERSSSIVQQRIGSSSIQKRSDPFANFGDTQLHSHLHRLQTARQHRQRRRQEHK